MDLRSLYYFTVVAQEQNFTRAAEKLNMSQPPLSNQIKNLEEELGSQLMIRGKRSVTLTEAGKLLYRRSAQLLDLAERTKSEIISMTEGLSGMLFLGIVEGKAPFMAAKWIAGFREEYPLVNFTLWNGGSDDIIAQLRKGTMEIGLIASPYDEEHLAGIPVGFEPWVAMIPEKHPLAADSEYPISLSELKDQPLIVPHRSSRVDAIRKWFRDAEIEPNIICELSNYLDALALVQAEAGISIFPQTTPVALPGVISRIITGPPKKAEYILAWDRAHPLSELAQSFIDFVSDYLIENPEPLTYVDEMTDVL